MGLACLQALPDQTPHGRVSRDGDELGIRLDRDIGIRTCRIGCRLRAGEVILAHEHGHVRRIAGEKYCLFRGGKAAAHDEDGASREELAVARRTIGNAVAAELLLAGKAGTAGACTGCQKHREARDLSPARLHMLHVAGKIDVLDLGEQHLGTEGFRLLAHRIGELRS